MPTQKIAPRFATNTNYVTPGKAWDATPTKLPVPLGRIATGWVPDARMEAEYANYLQDETARRFRRTSYYDLQNMVTRDTSLFCGDVFEGAKSIDILDTLDSQNAFPFWTCNKATQILGGASAGTRGNLINACTEKAVQQVLSPGFHWKTSALGASKFVNFKAFKMGPANAIPVGCAVQWSQSTSIINFLFGALTVAPATAAATIAAVTVEPNDAFIWYSPNQSRWFVSVTPASGAIPWQYTFTHDGTTASVLTPVTMPGAAFGANDVFTYDADNNGQIVAMHSSRAVGSATFRALRSSDGGATFVDVGTYTGNPPRSLAIIERPGGGNAYVLTTDTLNQVYYSLDLVTWTLVASYPAGFYVTQAFPLGNGGVLLNGTDTAYIAYPDAAFTTANLVRLAGPCWPGFVNPWGNKGFVSPRKSGGRIASLVSTTLTYSPAFFSDI